jgi:hypothetical protein
MKNKLQDVGIVENLENNEALIFFNPTDFRFILQDGINYAPTIKTLIRVMDTPKEDIYYYYIEEVFPYLVKIR